MFDWNLILMVFVNFVIPISCIIFAVYYRSLWISGLDELADKKAIISAVISHSEEQEKNRVKNVSKFTPVVEHKIIKRKTTKK